MWYGAQIAEAVQYYGPDMVLLPDKQSFDFTTLRKNQPILIVALVSSYDGSFSAMELN